MKVKFTAPTADFPFFHEVKVLIESEWKKIVSYNPDLGGKSVALFATKEEMIAGIRKVVKC